MAWSPTLNALRDLLADLYPTTQDAQIVVAEAGIPPGRIDFSGGALNFWHSILTEAERQRMVANLIAVPRRRYPAQDWQAFASLEQAIEPADRPAPATGPSAGPQAIGDLNPVALTLLAEAVQQNRLTLFVGAELPQDLTGLPSSKDLAQALAQRYRLPDGAASPTLADVAQQIGRRGDVLRFLRDRLETVGLKPGRLDSLLVQATGNLLITTRADDLLEKAFQAASRPVDVLRTDLDLTLRRPDRPALLMLYGDRNQPHTMTLTEDDLFDLSSQKRGLLNLVEQTLTGTTVLFLGYDLNSPDFVALWREVLRRLSENAPRAYACAGSSTTQAEKEMWLRRNIEILDAPPLSLIQALADRSLQ